MSVTMGPSWGDGPRRGGAGRLLRPGRPGRQRGGIAHQVPQAERPTRSPEAPLVPCPVDNGEAISGEPRLSEDSAAGGDRGVVAGHRPRSGVWCDCERNTIGAASRSRLTRNHAACQVRDHRARRSRDRRRARSTPPTLAAPSAPAVRRARPAPGRSGRRRTRPRPGRGSRSRPHQRVGAAASPAPGTAGAAGPRSRAAAGRVRRSGPRPAAPPGRRRARRRRAARWPAAARGPSRSTARLSGHEHRRRAAPDAGSSRTRVRAARRPSRRGSARRAGRPRRCPGGPRARWRAPAARRRRAGPRRRRTSAPAGDAARRRSPPADEPRPRPCGMRLVQRSASGGRGAPSASKRRVHRPHDEVPVVARAPRRRPRRAPRRRPVAVGRVADAHDDLVVQVEGEAEASKPGPRLALVAGTRTRDRRGSCRLQAERGGGGADVGRDRDGCRCCICRRAVSGSLRPWPVTVQTTRWPGSSRPRAAACSSPATPPRCAGSTKTPSLAGEQPVGGEDLPVGDRVDQAAGLVAGGDGAGPGRRVADPDRGGDRRRRRAPARRARSARRRRPGSRTSAARALTPVGGVLAVALPVRRDVAGVADRQAVDVGRVAERVDDLERGRLLALDAVRVDRVDQRHRVAARRARGPARGSRRSCRRPAAAGRRAPAPGPACRARSCPCGTSTAQVSPARAA